MRKLLIQVLVGIAGLWLATEFVPNVIFQGKVSNLIFAGIILGLLNFFAKPILKGITFPLRIITLNLFSIVIAMGLVWIVDIFFQEITIYGGLSLEGIAPLFWTTAIVFILSMLMPLVIREEDKNGKEKNKSSSGKEK